MATAVAMRTEREIYMEKPNFPKSVRIHIRRQKARMTREGIEPAEREAQLAKVYGRFGFGDAVVEAPVAPKKKVKKQVGDTAKKRAPKKKK
jgi:hypothetical protein